MYVDSTLVKANVGGYGLAPSGMAVAEFKEQAIEENGLFKITETAVDGNGAQHETVRYFQIPEGMLPLSPPDTDARWRTTRAGRTWWLQYQENAIVDRGGFILSRGATHASERESKAVAALMEKLPLRPVSLDGDSGYGDGRLRLLLEERNITAYIPIHTRHETSLVSTGEFVYHGSHLIFPQGKVLRQGSSHKRSRTYQYLSRQKDCQSCPVRETCLPPMQKRWHFTLTMYYQEYLRAKERNCSEEYREELRRRQTTAEGIFASLDRLSWARTRFQGLWKVDCEGHMAALAHNMKKLVQRLSRGVGHPGPALPTAVEAAVSGTALWGFRPRLPWAKAAAPCLR